MYDGIGVARVGGELIPCDDANLPVVICSRSHKSDGSSGDEIAFDLLPREMKLVGIFPHVDTCRLHGVGLVFFVVARRALNLRTAYVLVIFEDSELLRRYNLAY